MSRHLMARFRHLHAADGPVFDWKPVPRGGLEGYQAKLENGDMIELSGLPAKRKGQPTKWSYHILGPVDHDVELVEHPGGGYSWSKPGVWSLLGMETGHRQALGSGGQGDLKAKEEATGQTNHYTPLRLPTMHYDKTEAMLAAEQHYRALNRAGQGRSSVDSGFDYDDFFKREPPADEDFDIFGDR